MHLQNSVSPFGNIVAISQRGLFTGNRGIIHDPATNALLTKQWATPTWLVCDREFKDRRREVMAGRSSTELFFLDEAVALAAGHRPCFLCRREATERFKACWASARAEPPPSAEQMDAMLHAERLEHGRKRLHPIMLLLSDLPDGAVVPVAVMPTRCAPTSPTAGPTRDMTAPKVLDDADWLLTPPSTVMALFAG